MLEYLIKESGDFMLRIVDSSLVKYYVNKGNIKCSGLGQKAQVEGSKQLQCDLSYFLDPNKPSKTRTVFYQVEQQY